MSYPKRRPSFTLRCPTGMSRRQSDTILTFRYERKKPFGVFTVIADHSNLSPCLIYFTNLQFWLFNETSNLILNYISESKKKLPFLNVTEKDFFFSLLNECLIEFSGLKRYSFTVHVLRPRRHHRGGWVGPAVHSVHQNLDSSKHRIRGGIELFHRFIYHNACLVIKGLWERYPGCFKMTGFFIWWSNYSSIY